MCAYLLKTTGDQFITRQPDILGGRHSLERDLVFVRLLELLTGNDFIDEAFHTLNENDTTLLHLLRFLFANLSVGLHHLFDIFTGLVSPQHVVKRGLVKMLIDMVERVLGNVTNDQVGMLPDFTASVGFHLASEQFDKGGFTGTVWTENGNTRRERDLKGNVVELLDRLSGILETNFTHLEQGLLLSLDTIEKRRIGELEPVVVSGFQGIVGLGFWDSLNEVLEIALVSLNLEAVDVQDISDGVVQETGIVGNDDGCAGSEGGEVALQPSNVDDIEMVSGFVEQEDIGLEEHRTSQSQFHLPTTGKSTDSTLLAFVVETDSTEGFNDLSFGTLDTLVVKDELKDGCVFLRTVNVVLDVEGSDFFWGRESFNLTAKQRIFSKGSIKTK